MQNVKAYPVILTGGLNEAINNMELSPGELINASNYQEMDGDYHGYQSLKGWEAFDGRTAPSDVSVRELRDYGLLSTDGSTANTGIKICIEPDAVGGTEDYTAAFTEWSDYGSTITPSGSPTFNEDDDNTIFGRGSWEFALNTDYLSIPATNWDWQLDYTIDLWCRVEGLTGAGATILSIGSVATLTLDATGKLTFSYDTGASGPATAESVQDPTAFNSHSSEDTFKFVRITHEIDGANYITRLYVNGSLVDSNTTALINYPNTGPQPVLLQGDSTVAVTGVASLRLINDGGLSAQEGFLSTGLTHIVPQTFFRSPYYFYLNFDDDLREVARAAIGTVYDNVAIPSGSTGTISNYYDIGDILRTNTDPINYPTTGEETYVIGGYEMDITLPVPSNTTGNMLFRSTSSGWEDLGSIGRANIPATLFSDKEMLWRGSFSDWNATLSPIWATGVTGDIYYYYKGISGSAPKSLAAESSPSGYDDALVGDQPNFPAHVDFGAVIEDRLYLVYKNSLHISGIGSPLRFDGSVDNSDVIVFPSEIKGIKPLKDGVVAIFLERSIEFLKGAVSSQYLLDGGTGWSWEKSVFTENINNVYNTQVNGLGDVYYTSRQGISSLRATDIFGGFEANSLSEKINRTVLSKVKSGSVIGSVIVQDDAQYKIFFDDGTGFSLTIDEDRSIKGAIPFDLGFNVTCVGDGDNDEVFVADDSYYVYELNKGTSANGDYLDSSFQTSYYSYNSPTYWKRLQSLLFEITADNYQQIGITVFFSYDRGDIPDDTQTFKFMRQSGDVWSLSLPTVASYSNTPLAVPKYYSYGNGANFSIKVDVSNKYFDQHIIHNFIAEIVMLGRQM